MLSKTFLKKNFLSKFSSTPKFNTIFRYTNLYKNFAEIVSASQTIPKKTHGGLADADRIFTNVYRDGDPFIEGAIKRVRKLI